jgi:hypothetical protein
MSQAIAALLVLAPGWACWRWLQRWDARPNPVLCFATGAVSLPGFALFAVHVLGIGWSETALAVIGLAFLLAGALVRFGSGTTHWRRPSFCVLAAAVPALAQAFLFSRAWQPTWDFRYIWGLKANAFALAGGIDARWLEWPENGFHHADYPPHWPTLLAALVKLDFTAETAALLWQVVLLLGLSAACWEAVRSARASLQVLGAAVGAFAPVMLMPRYGGNADLLVAFLAAAAFALLPRVQRRRPPDGATVVALGLVVATLVLAKNEGLVLGFGVVLGALVTARRRHSLWIACAFVVAALAWRGFMLWHGLPSEPRALSPAQWQKAALDIARFLWTHRLDLPAGLLLAWLATAIALCRRETAGVAIAVGVWAAGVVAAYLTSIQGVPWHLATSFDRVVAAPLAGAAAVALSAFSPHSVESIQPPPSTSSPR